MFSYFQLFQTGDRTPVDDFPSNTYEEKNWPNGYGHLTQVNK